jgi:hypothetical protein
MSDRIVEWCRRQQDRFNTENKPYTAKLMGLMAGYFKRQPPKNWWTYHTKDCGTKYRGCSPDCPKDIYERTGEWRG